MVKQISVVVPTLNSAATLDWTLLSLRCQLDCHLKIIVVDSGSTDDTVEVCKRWDAEYLYEPPGNMYRAINAGLRLCKTDWVTYLNSDDIVYRDSYARLIEYGESSNAHVIYGYSDYMDEAGRFLFSFYPAKPSWLNHLFRSGLMGFAQPAAIFRNEVFRTLRGFNEEFRSISDFDFFWRAIRADHVFKQLPSPTVSGFRLHKNQLSNRESALTRKEKESLLTFSTNPPNLKSRIILTLWRIRNANHYFLRFLRTQSVKGACS